MPPTLQSAIDKFVASGEFWVYVWVFAISIWAGVVNVYRSHKEGEVRRHVGIFEWIGECATSGFVGILVYLLCRWGGLNDFLAAAFTGIAAHMGTRALPLMEDVLTGWMSRIGGKDRDV